MVEWLEKDGCNRRGAGVKFYMESFSIRYGTPSWNVLPSNGPLNDSGGDEQAKPTFMPMLFVMRKMGKDPCGGVEDGKIPRCLAMSLIFIFLKNLLHNALFLVFYVVFRGEWKYNG